MAVSAASNETAACHVVLLSFLRNICVGVGVYVCLICSVLFSAAFDRRLAVSCEIRYFLLWSPLQQEHRKVAYLPPQLQKTVLGNFAKA